MPGPLPRKPTPQDAKAAEEQRVRAARMAMFQEMLKEALDG